MRSVIATAQSSPIVSGSHALVGAHEPPEGLRVEAAVGVRDERPGQAVDARIAREGALGELRELAVVARRQVVADLAELLVDDVEVVDEPLGGRRDRALFADRPGDHAVRLDEDAAVLRDARLDGMALPRLSGDDLGTGERARVLLQPLDAEELGENRLLEVGLRPNPPADATWRVGKGLVRSHRGPPAGGPRTRS